MQTTQLSEEQHTSKKTLLVHKNGSYSPMQGNVYVILYIQRKRTSKNKWSKFNFRNDLAYWSVVFVNVVNVVEAEKSTSGSASNDVTF